MFPVSYKSEKNWCHSILIKYAETKNKYAETQHISRKIQGTK